MEAELDASIGYEKNHKGDVRTSNKRNGHSPKTLKSQYGQFQIDVPRNHDGEFGPKLIPKYHRLFQPYSIDINSIARNSHSYSGDRVWAESTKIFLTADVLIGVQKKTYKSIDTGNTIIRKEIRQNKII